MRLDPSKIPSGLSWGARGFRIGKSVSGNWWISLGLPFGFRYSWLLGRPKSIEQSYNQLEEVVVNDSIDILPAPASTPSIINRANTKSYSKVKK